MAHGRSLVEREITANLRRKHGPKIVTSMPASSRRRGGYTMVEEETKAQATRYRQVQRKLKVGRPGRPSNAPTPTFSWESVVARSQKKRKVAA